MFHRACFVDLAAFDGIEDGIVTIADRLRVGTYREHVDTGINGHFTGVANAVVFYDRSPFQGRQI